MAAISIPGVILSQLLIHTIASALWAFTIYSTLSAKLIVENAFKYYEEGDESVLPRSIATREAFLNAMTLDIAMGGSTNTVLHLLAIAHEAEVDFKMDDIDMLSRKSP